MPGYIASHTCSKFWGILWGGNPGHYCVQVVLSQSVDLSDELLGSSAIWLKMVIVTLALTRSWYGSLSPNLQHQHLEFLPMR